MKLGHKSRSKHCSVHCDPLNSSIFLRGDITTKTPSLIEEAIQKILRGDPELSDWLFLFINSPGGDSDATSEILHLLDKYIDRLVTIASRDACSGAMLLAQRGTYRFATSPTDFLMHSVYEYPRKVEEDMTDRWHHLKLDEIYTDNAFQLTILTAHGYPDKTIRQLYHEKTIFGCKLARKLGLIDEILPADSPALLRQKALELIKTYRREDKKRRLSLH